MLVRRSVLFLLIGLFAGAVSATHNAPVSAPRLAAQLDKGDAPLILDVRSEQEFQSGHVPGATNIPYQELPDNLSKLSGGKDREIVVYCESGGRADVANNFLESAGYTRVHNLEGHMRHWREGGFPQE